MSATYESTEDYTVCISNEGLRRLQNDNDLLRNLRRAPRLHTAGVVFGGAGLVICLCVMFARALMGNS